MLLNIKAVHVLTIPEEQIVYNQIEESKESSISEISLYETEESKELN